MTKYEPLTRYLQKQRLERVPMTFSDIEVVLKMKLPRSADSHRAWWSNNPLNNVMTKAWLDAGFESEQVDLPGRKLVFRRVPSVPLPSKSPVSREWVSGFTEAASPAFDEPSCSTPAAKHGLFGWLRGTLSVAAGTDLTSPADPHWSKRIDDDGKPAA